MQILGHGIDIVDIERLRGVIERQGEDFLQRTFTTEERQYCQSRKDPFQHFAARFAAKEAYGKALGLGIGGSGELCEVGVKNTTAGPPQMELSGKAEKLFHARGAKKIFLSLAHDGGIALASVIITDG